MLTMAFVVPRMCGSPLVLNKRRIIVLGAVCIIFWGLRAQGASRRGHLQLSVALVVNSIEGSSHTQCEVFEHIQASSDIPWWVAVAEVDTSSTKAIQGVEKTVWCGRGLLKKQLPNGTVPYFIGDALVRTRVQPWTLSSERVVAVHLAVSRQKKIGHDDRGKPRYKQRVENREFPLIEGKDVLIPLLVANDSQTKRLGIYELFLKISVQRSREAPSTEYGTITVRSQEVTGTVLLDGGAVGQLTANGELKLFPVPVGFHVVGIDDATAGKYPKIVRVKPNQVARVALGPSDQFFAPAYELAPMGKNPQGYQEYRRSRDQAVVVKIPAGVFLMGNKETERSPLEHSVYVSDFLIDKLGVTWLQYKRYAEVTGVSLPPRHPYWGIHDNHPVVYVTWEEAKAYCEWVGGRLPTEAEREKAARGTDGRKYPWGNEEPDSERGVFRRAWGRQATAAVGTHPAGMSPYGVHDMGGNVWEWCSDWYDEDYYAVSPTQDPKGPLSGTARVLRGGSWDSRPTVLSASCRNWGAVGYREGDFGFRCVMNAP